MRRQVPTTRTHFAPVSRGTARFARAAGGAGVIVNVHTLGRAQTIRIVDVLSRTFEFIGLDDLPERLERPTRTPFALLTFDDGKRSNATVSAPTLLELGVPAVFYVVTGFVSSGRPLWFDMYRALVRTADPAPPGLTLEGLKQEPHEVRIRRLERELRRSGAAVPDDDDTVAMSWEDARRLAARGFVIGAHGVEHAILTRESREYALSDIRVSLDAVSRELGSTCRTFAFANGNHDEGLCRYAVACGATTVMTTDPTWVTTDTPLWRLPRVQLYQSSSPAHIRLKVALAAIPGVLTNPDGTGRAYRAGASPRRRRT